MSEPRATSPLLQQGIDLFNSGKYFQCHEVLEDLWNLQAEPEKQFTQGLIQIAVATYHLQRSNFAGATKLYERGLRRISAFLPSHAGIDVAGLAKQTEQLQALCAAGTAPDAASLPRILMCGSSD